MTIYRTAYDTTMCNGFVVKKTVDAVERALVSGWLRNAENSTIPCVDNDEEMIPAFAHPLIVSDRDKREKLVIDVRGFGKWDGAQHVFRIRNELEYRLLVHRAKLNNIWLKQSPTILRDISQMPMSVYANWIAEAVAKRFALDPQEQFNLAILAAIYYSSLFNETGEIDETIKMRTVNAVTRSIRAKAEDVFKILDQVSEFGDSINQPPLTNLSSFCNAAAHVCGSVRLKELNVGLLLTIMGGSWFGNNAKEMVAIALEHPPTWLAILMHAASERSFKNSGIAKITERNTYRESGKDFLRAVLHLISVTDNE